MTSHPTIKPPTLRPGDTIGVVAPSSGVAALCPRRFERGLADLRQRGFEVCVGAHATGRHGHTSGSIAERVSDLHAMFADDDVAAVITTIGGTCSHQLLEHLDFGLIVDNPKALIGYSDITALHIALLVEANLTTFLGPAVLPQFGEFGGIDPFSADHFGVVLMSGAAAGPVPVSSSWISERLRWDLEDDRPRARTPNPGPRTIKAGTAEGVLVAGNMGTLLLLAGTRWWPRLDGVILCLEDDESETPASIDRYLTQLRHLGVFGQVAGVALGRFDTTVGIDDGLLDELVLQATDG